MPRTANVAIPAANPERRINGSPTTNANAAPRPVASSSDSTFPSEWSLRIGKRFGMIPRFTSAEIVISPAENAPTATKLICPKDRTPEFPMKR